MLPPTRPLNSRRTDPSFPIPSFSDWRYQLRVVAESDTNKDDIPPEQMINLGQVVSENGTKDASRFGLNTIVLLVKVVGTSCTINLWAKEDGVYYLVRSDAVTTNTVLTYKDLPPLSYVPEIVELVGDGVELGGGGTF